MEMGEVMMDTRMMMRKLMICMILTKRNRRRIFLRVTKIASRPQSLNMEVLLVQK